ncbi:hypothetical protein QBC37DRAFT_148243 [Rhypophila decipiens]|uniref:Uncharacterized protein n=1 Tax=Rhypophila decipiens TaxID=261697 RepID=A0AAN6Y8B1_9PEZI|nr:hypothetical protein QBC37DRAFT_148243 [Rhypophila decipiens]
MICSVVLWVSCHVPFRAQTIRAAILPNPITLLYYIIAAVLSNGGVIALKESNSSRTNLASLSTVLVCHRLLIQTSHLINR